MTTLTYDNFTESRTYNSLLQLNRLWTTQSGAGTVNRLLTATAGAWSQSYVYDGFGNVLGLNGAAVNGTDSSTNRLGAARRGPEVFRLAE